MNTQSICDGESTVNSYERNYKTQNMSDPQLIDSFMSKVKGAWSLYKFIHFVKVAHLSRFSHKQFDEFKALNSEKKINNEFLKEPQF